MTTIIQKAAQVKHDVDNNGEAGRELARSLGRLATDAIRYGMGSTAWRDYMSNFATTPQQLDRLWGRETAFNNTEWGYRSLAYMVANSTCTVESLPTGVINGFEPEMIANLNNFEEEAPN